MKFPFDELNMRDPEHVAWVKSRRDPELWHAAAIAVLVYLGDPRGFIVWLLDQPEPCAPKKIYPAVARSVSG